MSKKKKLKVMVASSVYGFEEPIVQLCAALNAWGYEVLNSYIGTIPTDSDHPNIEDCLQAVRDSDLFIGIVRTTMGTGNVGDKNITFEEMRTAIDLNKPRWFCVDKTVVVARQVINHMILAEDIDKEKNNQRNVLESGTVVLKDSSFLDSKSIDALNLISKGRKNEEGDTVGRWYHAFEMPSQILDYVKTNLGDYEKISNKIKEDRNNEQ